MRRVAIILIGVIVGAGFSALAGCGEEDGRNTPTLDEIVEEGEVRTVTYPDGTTRTCLFFAENGYHKSWIVLDCWE